MSKTIIYKHWICMAHRLVGHVGGCGRIHGHNYLIEIELEASELDEKGMILDFSDVKQLLGGWLDENWDHRLILSKDDPIYKTNAWPILESDGAVIIPVNPTAENMADFLRLVFTALLAQNNMPQKIASVTVHETHKGRAVSRS